MSLLCLCVFYQNYEKMNDFGMEIKKVKHKRLQGQRGYEKKNPMNFALDRLKQKERQKSAILS